MMKIIIFIIFLICSKFGISWREDCLQYEVGCNTFNEVLNSAVFVDKTMLIKEFFNYKYVLITAPRRFGKSMNMDMIRRFVEVSVDLNGTRIEKDKTENFKIFSGKYNKVNGSEFLDIYKNVNISMFFNETFGEFPVLFLDFKSLTGQSYIKFIHSFRSLVSEEYLRHQYLFNSNKLKLYPTTSRMLKRYYDQILDNNLIEDDLIDSMHFLSRILYIHFNKMVIVLIDEYDAPVQDVIFNAGKDIDKIIKFIKRFIYKLLKSNEYVERALMNAGVRLSGVYTTDANNINQFLFNEIHPFKKYYGFTENEVRGLTKKLNISKNMASIRSWYDGYNVPNRSLKLYNVFTIVKYFESRQFKNYWVRTGSIYNSKYIFLNDNIRKLISNLLKNKKIQIETIDTITIDDIIVLSNLVKKREYSELSHKNMYLFLIFLLDLGYLTATNIKGNMVTVKIPNKEIKDELFRQMYSVESYMERLHLTENDVSEYINSILWLGETTSSYKMLGKSVLNLFKHVDMPEKAAELKDAMAVFPRPYNKFNTVNSQVRIKVNDTTRRVSRKTNATMIVPVYDFIDILIIRKDYTGIIVGLNYFNTDSKSKFSLYTGLEQIINNGYFRIFDSSRYKVRNKLYIGVTVKQRDKKTGKPQCIVSALYNNEDLKNNKTCIID